MNSLLKLILALAVLGVSGCGGRSFGGGSQKSGGSGDAKQKGEDPKVDSADGGKGGEEDPSTDQAAGANPDGTVDEEITELDLTETPDGEVIGKCLAEWGKHPFKKKDLAQHRTLEVQAQMLGRSDLQDLEPSEEPEIVVVKVKSSTLGAASLVLMNPKGWYCLDMGAESLGATDVTLHCEARIGNQTTSSGTLGRASMNKSCG